MGKLVHQLTVRNQSTKDNVGTLPLFAYTTPDQPPRPLDFSTADDLTARETVVTEIEQEVVRGAILFEANSVVVVERDHIRGYPNRGPFFVGIVVADVTEGGEEDSDLDSDDDENPADVIFLHNIRENRHQPKLSGPFVHFSQTSCKCMLYR